MYLRIDPAKSASFDFFVLDQDDDLRALQKRDQLVCSSGSHSNEPGAIFLVSQDITCVDTASSVYTLLYSTV